MACDITPHVHRSLCLPLLLSVLMASGCSDGFQTVSPAELREDDLTQGLEGMLVPREASAATPVVEAEKAPEPDTPAEVAEVAPPPEPPKPALDPAVIERALSCTATAEDLAALEAGCDGEAGCNVTEVGSVHSKFSWPEGARTIPAGSKDVSWYVMLSAHEASEGREAGCAVNPKRFKGGENGGSEYGLLSVFAKLDLRSTANKRWRSKRIKIGSPGRKMADHVKALADFRAGVPLCFGTAADGAAGRKLARALQLAGDGGVNSLDLVLREDRAWMAGGVAYDDRHTPYCSLKIDRIVTVSR